MLPIEIPPTKMKQIANTTLFPVILPQTDFMHKVARRKNAVKIAPINDKIQQANMHW